jgi:hypothetical protein
MPEAAWARNQPETREPPFATRPHPSAAAHRRGFILRKPIVMGRRALCCTIGERGDHLLDASSKARCSAAESNQG